MSTRSLLITSHAQRKKRRSKKRFCRHCIDTLKLTERKTTAIGECTPQKDRARGKAKRKRERRRGKTEKIDMGVATSNPTQLNSTQRALQHAATPRSRIIIFGLLQPRSTRIFLFQKPAGRQPCPQLRPTRISTLPFVFVHNVTFANINPRCHTGASR